MNTFSKMPPLKALVDKSDSNEIETVGLLNNEQNCEQDRFSPQQTKSGWECDTVCRRRSVLKCSDFTDLKDEKVEVKDEEGCEKEDRGIEEDELESQCSDCSNEAKTKQLYTVYHKRKEDSFVRDSSIRNALMKISPKWLRSLVQDPEFVMTEERNKSSDKIHRQADSLFSTSSGFTNYRGLLNLCLILLVLSNARLFLENIIKYGILIDPIQWLRLFFMNQSYGDVCLSLLVGSNVFVLTVYYTEKAVQKGWLSENMTLAMQATTLTLQITTPALVVLYLHPNPVLSTTVLGLYTVQFLKLVSYASVNKWCRQSTSPRRAELRRTKSVSVSDGSMLSNGKDSKEENMVITYPENLNLKGLFYFMVAPTLCYELNFPRTLRIRKRFLLKRIIEMLFIIQLILGCIQQWILPLIHNSMKPLAEMDGARVVERLLKLAIPNHFIWLMFFYWFFHSTLNVIAELCTFGDREFYKDWWNSDTVNQFWSSWNVPVHRWATRHLYKPLLKRGFSKMQASVAVFFLSAFFHEYLVSVPLQMFRLWAFMGMLGQVPLALVQVKYIHGKFGNLIVWLSLILGQPIAILAYVHDYYVTHVGPTVVPVATNATFTQ